jgi:hypothetical protein
VKIFNVADNKLQGPFPEFLINSLTGVVSTHCSELEDYCNFFIVVDGGNNQFTCPAARNDTDAAAGTQPANSMDLLLRQGLGCTGKNGVLYEVSSVLQGKPVALKAADVPARPSSQPAAAGSTVGHASSSHVSRQAVAAAAEAPSHDQARHKLPPGAIAGIVIGALAAAALVAAVGYIMIYRRWYTVRAAQSFQKMQEGALAATGGAIINSSAPNAGLPTLTGPPGVAPGCVGGDDRV